LRKKKKRGNGQKFHGGGKGKGEPDARSGGGTKISISAGGEKKRGVFQDLGWSLRGKGGNFKRHPKRPERRRNGEGGNKTKLNWGE